MPIQPPRLHHVAIPLFHRDPSAMDVVYSPISPAFSSPGVDGGSYSSDDDDVDSDSVRTPLTADCGLALPDEPVLFRRESESDSFDYRHHPYHRHHQHGLLSAHLGSHHGPGHKQHLYPGVARPQARKQQPSPQLPFSRPITPCAPQDGFSPYLGQRPPPASQLQPIALPSLFIPPVPLRDLPSLSPSSALDPCSVPPSPPPSNEGRTYSERFPEDHTLNRHFVDAYELGDELGAGGYGFVMTAIARNADHVGRRQEAAVKFIIKDKVPEHAWVEDEAFGRIPSEVMLLSVVEHENIVRCLDIFEDTLYFYLVQELHGTPWVSRKKAKKSEPAPAPRTPALTPSSSCSTLDSLHLHTPHPTDAAAWEAQIRAFADQAQHTSPAGSRDPSQAKAPGSMAAPSLIPPPRPQYTRRASHDLFECIEQSKHKRLSEPQARYIFAQVVEAVHYLESQGITHRDIKDENLVVDADLKVKLIDFGSAVVSDPREPRPYYQLFYGTTAYAASEILRREPYQAPQAEIWTLGVLLSYLLTGASPFASESDAIAGRIALRPTVSKTLSGDCLDLLRICLEPEPAHRADIQRVRQHVWLEGALRQGPILA